MNWYLKVLKNHYLDFGTRARRKEYWMFTLINVLISWSFSLLDLAIGTTFFSIISSVYTLLVLIPSIAVSVRRLHDVGKSGWFYLLIFLPIIGWIWLFVLFCTDSDYGSNEWGDNPKGVGNNAELDQIGKE